MKELIVVTGGTGYIGSHTTVELMETGYDVLIIDNLANSRIEVLDGIEKITGRLGWRPAVEFEDGVRRMLADIELWRDEVGPMVQEILDR